MTAVIWNETYWLYRICVIKTSIIVVISKNTNMKVQGKQVLTYMWFIGFLYWLHEVIFRFEIEGCRVIGNFRINVITSILYPNSQSSCHATIYRTYFREYFIWSVRVVKIRGWAYLKEKCNIQLKNWKISIR